MNSLRVLTDGTEITADSKTAYLAINRTATSDPTMLYSSGDCAISMDFATRIWGTPIPIKGRATFIAIGP